MTIEDTDLLSSILQASTPVPQEATTVIYAETVVINLYPPRFMPLSTASQHA